MSKKGLARQRRLQQAQNRRQKRGDPRQPSGASLRRQPELSPSRVQPADRVLGILNAVDGMAGLRNGLRLIAREKGEWAGIPMPLDNTNLVVEPTYPWAKELAEMGKPSEETTDSEDAAVERNTWYSHRLQTNVSLFEEDGRIKHFVWPKLRNQGALLMETLNAADAWGIEQEGAAVQTLGSLLRHRQFKQYLLTGMFMERSKRSGVSYMFRRLRPTLAISTRHNPVRILCALCLHPIAHYKGSWAGAMCPSDDVIAHLMLMRGDEHLFWRRANQHSAWEREAGL